MLQNVVDVGADSREHVDAREIAGRALEARVDRFAVDHQHLAVPARLVEHALERLGLGVLELKRVDHDQAVLGLGRERHLEAERADLLVERLLELAQASTVSLAAADEDRGAAIAVTSRAAALLATPLLAGARNVGPLAGRAGGAAAILELPSDDAVQDVGARLDTEHGIIELDVAGCLAVEFLDLHLHGSALLVLVGFGLAALGLVALFTHGRGGLVAGASLLLVKQLFLLLERNLGLHLVLGSGLDHAGRRFLVLGSSVLLLED